MFGPSPPINFLQQGNGGKSLPSFKVTKVNYSNYLMLGLDQAECPRGLLFIFLIALSSYESPAWTVMKDVSRGCVRR